VKKNTNNYIEIIKTGGKGEGKTRGGGAGSAGNYIMLRSRHGWWSCLLSYLSDCGC